MLFGSCTSSQIDRCETDYVYVHISFTFLPLLCLLLLLLGLGLHLVFALPHHCLEAKKMPANSTCSDCVGACPLAPTPAFVTCAETCIEICYDVIIPSSLLLTPNPNPDLYLTLSKPVSKCNFDGVGEVVDGFFVLGDWGTGCQWQRTTGAKRGILQMVTRYKLARGL